MGFPGGSVVKNPPANQGRRVWPLGGEDPLEKETATHSSIVAWEIPWTEEPGKLKSMESQRVGHEYPTTIIIGSHYVQIYYTLSLCEKYKEFSRETHQRINQSFLGKVTSLDLEFFIRKLRWFWVCGFPRGMTLLPWSHLAAPGDIFGCNNVKYAVLLASKDAAKHGTTHKTAPHSKKIIWLKCQ